jgi:hypothetical protein
LATIIFTSAAQIHAQESLETPTLQVPSGPVPKFYQDHRKKILSINVGENLENALTKISDQGYQCKREEHAATAEIKGGPMKGEYKSENIFDGFTCKKDDKFSDDEVVVLGTFPTAGSVVYAISRIVQFNDPEKLPDAPETHAKIMQTYGIDFNAGSSNALGQYKGVVDEKGVLTTPEIKKIYDDIGDVFEDIRSSNDISYEFYLKYYLDPTFPEKIRKIFVFSVSGDLFREDDKQYERIISEFTSRYENFGTPEKSKAAVTPNL